MKNSSKSKIKKTKSGSLIVETYTHDGVTTTHEGWLNEFEKTKLSNLFVDQCLKEIVEKEIQC